MQKPTRADFPKPGDEAYVAEDIPPKLRTAKDWVQIKFPLERRIEALVGMTKSEDNRVRMRAIQALQKIAGDEDQKQAGTGHVELTLKSVMTGQKVEKDAGVMGERDA